MCRRRYLDVRNAISAMIARHSEYRVKRGEPYYEEGTEVYFFSSHHFIEQYRLDNQGAYANILMRFRRGRLGQDRAAHGWLAARLGRFARTTSGRLVKVGRIRASRDVHGNMVRPMWWVLRGRL